MPNNVVSFLTQNQKLCNQLQAKLHDLVVLKADNLEAVTSSVKHNAVGAVVLHVKDSHGWMIFELLRTGFPDIPRFAILAPSLSGDDYAAEALATKYGASAIVTEKQGVSVLASLIQNLTHIQPEEISDSKSQYLTIYGEVSAELVRLQSEFTTTGLRTLPQPQIGEDSQDRLKTALRSLQAVRITP